MSETIGRVDFIVDLDGTTVPAQARRLGQEAGALAGREFNRSFEGQLGQLESGLRKRFKALGSNAGTDFGDGFSKALAPSMARIGRQLDSAFSNSSGLSGFRRELTAVRDDMEEIVIEFDDVEEGLNNVNDSSNRTSSSFGRYTDSMSRAEAATRRMSAANDDHNTSSNRLSRTIGALRNNMRGLFSSFGDGIRNLTGFNNELDRSDRSSRSLLGSFRQLPRGIKQALFYTTLFASLAGEIAVLGSVAGSSLAVLGTVFAALGAGALVTVVGFQGMLGPLSELGPNARAASIELRGIGEAFAGLQEGIRERLFQDMAEPFRQVAAIAPAIQNSLNGVASAMRDVLAQLALSLGSTRGLEVMNALLVGFQPILRELGSAFINLGAALGTIFVAALPSAQTFAAYLDQIFTRFNEFLKSNPGQNALADFFNTLNIVMPSVIGLLSSVGSLLAGLVTPTTIALLVQTLDTLSRFMPALNGILLVIADLNPIGIIATILETIGAAMVPLLPAFSTLATTIREGLMTIIPQLAPILTSIVGAIIPLAQALVDNLIPAFITLLPAIQQVATEVLPLLVDALLLVLPLIPPLAVLIVGVIDKLTQLAVAVMPIVISALEGLVAVLQFLLTPTSEAMAGFQRFTDGVSANIETLNSTVNQWFADVIAGFRQWVSDVGANLDEFNAGVNQAINSFVSDTIGMFRDFFANTIGMFVDFFTNVVTGANNWARDVGNTVRKFVSDTIANISSFVSSAVSGFVSFFNSVVSGFNNFTSNVISAVSRFVSGAVAFFQGFWSTVQSGFSGFVNTVGSIFASITERILGPVRGIAGQVLSFFQGIPGGVAGIINNIVGLFAGLPGRVMAAIGNLAGRISNAISSAVNIKLPFTATGGMFNGAQARIIGEAGPEAVVPLRRNLSQVDPAVRELSAFAQGIPIKGKNTNNSTSTGPSKQITVAEGAIAVYSPDAKYSGVQVLDALVENL